MDEDNDEERDRPESRASLSVSRKKTLLVTSVVFAVTAFILLIILARSFKGVEYNQFGFKRRKASGKVYTDTVYSSGRYPTGITFNFKTFPRDAHFLELFDLEIFTSDRLQVSLSCSLQYFLRIEDLRLLHDRYDLKYESVLKNSARDAIKSAATQFSTRDYGTMRREIEDTLFEAARVRLGGICCPTWCDLPTGDCNTTNCVPRGSDSCGPGQLGFFASVRFFQLLYVTIDPDVIARNLKTLTQIEDAKQEMFLQTSQLVQIETQKMVEDINNTASELRQNATAQANLIRARSSAEAHAIVENAHSEGLKLIYDRLNISTQEQKASLNYLRTLRDHLDVHVSINFNSLVNAAGFN